MFVFLFPGACSSWKRSFKSSGKENRLPVERDEGVGGHWHGLERQRRHHRILKVSWMHPLLKHEGHIMAATVQGFHSNAKH